MRHYTSDKNVDLKRLVPIFFDGSEALCKGSDDDFLICLLKSGTTEVRINETKYVITAPTLICLNDEQTIEPLKTHEISAKSIYFDPTFINRNMTKQTIRSARYAEIADVHDYFLLEPFMKSDSNYGYFINLSPDLLQRTDLLFDECSAELGTQSDWYWPCRVRSYFIELLHVLERLYFNKNRTATPHKFDYQIPLGFEDIGDILMFININYQNKLSLDEISHQFSTSRSNINRRFKRVTGLTVFDYITEYRLFIASSMLRFTELSVEEISARVGFTYSNNFISCFKSRYGMPPNKFRSYTVDLRKTGQAPAIH
ncbi:MAG: AraC family transcriptional regulator [Clostridia bacterium]|nr:AraC family transcriptional regulator [Clostridia bacterium]